MNITKILRIVFLCSWGFHDWFEDESRYSAMTCKDCGTVRAVEWRD